MQQVKDIFAIVFYGVWICVGVALVFFIYNNYSALSGMGGQRGPGSNQMMQQQQLDPANGYGQGQGKGPQNMMGNLSPQDGTQSPPAQPTN